MAVSRCAGRNTAGDPCQAQPVRPSGWCWWHDPSTEAERDAKRREGGRNSASRVRARRQLAGDVRDLVDVKARLLVALGKVERGELGPGPAHAMAGLAKAIVTISGAVDFDARLTELEKAAGIERRFPA